MRDLHLCRLLSHCKSVSLRNSQFMMRDIGSFDISRSPFAPQYSLASTFSNDKAQNFGYNAIPPFLQNEQKRKLLGEDVEDFSTVRNSFVRLCIESLQILLVQCLPWLEVIAFSQWAICHAHQQKAFQRFFCQILSTLSSVSLLTIEMHLVPFCFH